MSIAPEPGAGKRRFTQKHAFRPLLRDERAAALHVMDRLTKAFQHEGAVLIGMYRREKARADAVDLRAARACEAGAA